MFHFYNACINLFNISSLFSCGIIIFSTSIVFTILSLFDLATACAISFRKNSLELSTTFLEAVFKKSCRVLKNCSFYFLAHDKSSYPLTYFYLFICIL